MTKRFSSRQRFTADELVGPTELAEATGQTPLTVRQWFYRGHYPAIKRLGYGPLFCLPECLKIFEDSKS